jgi:DNA-binding SARP family transcriptional activator
MLHVQLFGQLSIEHYEGGVRLAAVRLHRRAAGLLAFLALAQGRFFTRHELIETLWTDQAELPGVGTFNTTLWRLRRALQPPPLGRQDVVVHSDGRGSVGVPSDAALQLDVAEFARLVQPALAKPLEALEAADIAGLRRGVALYRDDMLVGFTDDWALRQRELHRRHFLNAMARLLHLAVLRQDLEGAITYAQGILDRDPLREDIHRELMRLFLLTGQRALALRQYEHCRDALRKELAIQPMRETVDVYQQIAEVAIGHGEAAARDGAREGFWPAAAPAPATWPAGAASALDLLSNARRHLALADTDLQQCLPLVGGGARAAN